MSVGFELVKGTWKVTGMNLYNCSEPVRYKEASEEELVMLMDQIIQEHCGEKTGVSEIKIISTEKTKDGLLVTAEYSSENGNFILTNRIKVDLKSSVVSGYYFHALNEETVTNAGLKAPVHKSVKVNYTLDCDQSRPTGVSSSGSATLRVDIDVNGVARVNGTIGNIVLNLSGGLSYPDGRLTLSGSQQKIPVRYNLIFNNMEGDIVFNVSPSLYYSDTLTGTIRFSSVAVGVDDFSIVLK